MFLRRGRDDLHWVVTVDGPRTGALLCTASFSSDRVILKVTNDPTVTITVKPGQGQGGVGHEREVECTLAEPPAGRPFVDGDSDDAPPLTIQP